MALNEDQRDMFSLLPTEICFIIFVHLRRVWPVGLRNWFSNRRDLGWQAITQVNKEWRNLATRMSQLWADDLCALYNRDAITEFLERSGRAPLTIDLNRLQRGSYRRTFDPSILPFLISPEIVSRARTIRSDYHQNSVELLRSVSITDFHHLTRLDLFLLKQRNSFTGFYAPLLEKLKLRSDAKQPEEAPIAFLVMASLLSRCPRISELGLDHVVGGLLGESSQIDRSASPVLRLHELDINSFDETLATHVLAIASIEQECVKRFSFDRVSDLSATHALVKTASPHTPCTVVIGHGFVDSVAFDGTDTTYTTHFCVSVLYDRVSVIYRLHWDASGWNWTDLIQSLSPGHINILIIRNTSARDSDTPPPEVDLPAFMNLLHDVKHVELDDITHIFYLQHLPVDCSLQSLKLQCEDYNVPDELATWLLSRSLTMRGLEITLEGEAWPIGDPRFYDAEDSDVLVEIEHLCTLRDNRISCSE